AHPTGFWAKLSPEAARTFAGVDRRYIDAVFAATSSHAFPTLSVCEYLGIRPKFVDGTNIGGSSFELHLLPATLAMEAGLCDAALICYGS
ncbi:thiolase, partial [Paenibacillus polymyxa]|nr:thiolase [Paenibacillus polymyxa]